MHCEQQIAYHTAQFNISRLRLISHGPKPTPEYVQAYRAVCLLLKSLAKCMGVQPTQGGSFTKWSSIQSLLNSYQGEYQVTQLPSVCSLVSQSIQMVDMDSLK